MNEIKRLKLNLQHFAEDNPNDPEGKDKQSGEQQGDDDQKVFELTQKEKEEKALSEREKAIAEREKAQALKELKSDVVDDLKEQELPTSFADALIKIEDNEEIKDVIRQIKKDFDSAVGEKVKEATRQSTPNNQSSSFGNQQTSGKSFEELANKYRIIK